MPSQLLCRKGLGEHVSCVQFPFDMLDCGVSPFVCLECNIVLKPNVSLTLRDPPIPNIVYRVDVVAEYPDRSKSFLLPELSDQRHDIHQAVEARSTAETLATTLLLTVLARPFLAKSTAVSP